MAQKGKQMSQIKKDKVVVIGSGNVGESVAFSLAVGGKASEVVIVDIAEDRALGSALDINHVLPFYRQLSVRKAGYEECADAGIIVVSAGVARKPGQTRLDLAKVNVSIAKSIAHNIMEYAKDPIIIVISNPADVLTYVIQKETGLPAHRVIGTGTLLDTARFRYVLAEKCNVAMTDVNSYVLGEHGDSQVPVWSSATIAGIPLADYCAQKGIDLEPTKAEMTDAVKFAGAKVISLKGATYLGVALNTAQLINTILGNENAILPVCHVVTEEIFGESDIAISMPCIIDNNGIKDMLKVSVSAEEEELLHKSAGILKDFIGQAISE